MAFSREMIEEIGAWCFTSSELALDRKQAWAHFFGEDDPRPIKYWTNADERVSRERRFLGWFIFDFTLRDGTKPAEVAAKRLYSGSTQEEALKAVSGARYLFAVATGVDRRSVYLEVEDESFEVRSPTWAASLRAYQAIVAHLVPVRQGYWLPGPGWLIWPVSLGPGMRSNLKAYQTDPVSTERHLQGRLDTAEKPEPQIPRDDSLGAAVARMSAWAQRAGQSKLAMSADEWRVLVQKHQGSPDIMSFAHEVVERAQGLRSKEEFQEVLGLSTNIWNNTPQPDRGGLSPNEMVELHQSTGAKPTSKKQIREKQTPSRQKSWHFDPDRGGMRIPDTVKRHTEQQLRRYAEQHFAGLYTRLDIRFRGQFCYVDAYTEPEEDPAGWPPADWPETRDEYLERLRNTPTHLCRLRYFGRDDHWGFAFYTYSNERYELSVFPSGEFFGPPKEAFRVSAEAYLR